MWAYLSEDTLGQFLGLVIYASAFSDFQRLVAATTDGDQKKEMLSFTIAVITLMGCSSAVSLFRI